MRWPLWLGTAGRPPSFVCQVRAVGTPVKWRGPVPAHPLGPALTFCLLQGAPGIVDCLGCRECLGCRSGSVGCVICLTLFQDGHTRRPQRAGPSTAPPPPKHTVWGNFACVLFLGLWCCDKLAQDQPFAGARGVLVGLSTLGRVLVPCLNHHPAQDPNAQRGSRLRTGRSPFAGPVDSSWCPWAKCGL